MGCALQTFLLLLPLPLHTMAARKEVKPGHEYVKEYHLHVYWAQNNPQQEEEALRIRDLLIEQVAAGKLVVVLTGVTSELLPGLDDSKVPSFNTGPLGPHPAGSFEVWSPQEYLAEAMSILMYHRGNLSILVHPLGKTEISDHTTEAMWLGPSWPLDTSVLDRFGGDPPQYPELGLGYSAHA